MVIGRFLHVYCICIRVHWQYAKIFVLLLCLTGANALKKIWPIWWGTGSSYSTPKLASICLSLAELFTSERLVLCKYMGLDLEKVDFYTSIIIYENRGD